MVVVPTWDKNGRTLKTKILERTMEIKNKRNRRDNKLFDSKGLEEEGILRI